MDKTKEEHRVEAGRGVPVEKNPSFKGSSSQAANKEDSERLDDRVRKAGI